MAATKYDLTADDWTDCDAADDCTVQLRGGAPALVTTATAKPAADAEGLTLSREPGDPRYGTFQKPGLKLWARAFNGTPTSIKVER